MEGLRPDIPGGVLKLAPSGSPEAEDIQREAALLAAIPTPQARDAHIAPLLSHGEDERYSWLLQQDVGEWDLAQHWAREGVSWRGVLDVGQAIGSALACLHAHGVLHRDVKEGNIVVAQGHGPDRYHLVDLGIGRRLDHRSAVTMDLRGSHDRVPPEAVTAGRKVGPAGDVFVLCKLLAQGLVGSPNTPWPDDVDAQLTTCGLEPDDPRHLALVRLLARGMRLEPAERPSAAELTQGFADIRAGRLDAPRRRWWLPIASFTAAGALVAVVATAMLRPEAAAPPTIAFEDVSEAWAVAVPSPDTAPKQPGAEPSSGFFGHPSLGDLDRDGSIEILLPRQGRVWATTAPQHLRDLVLRWTDGRFEWTIDDRPGPARQVFTWMLSDLDADGILDRTGLGHDPEWMSQTVVLRSGADFEPEVLDTPFPFLVPTTAGTWQFGSTGWLAGQGGPEAERWSAEAIGIQPSAWMDLDGDGVMELLTRRDERPTLLRWRDGAWQAESLAELDPWQHGAPPGGTMLPADMDGDGDEDLVIGDKKSASLVFMEAMGDELVRVRGADLPVLDPGEAMRETYGSTVAVDLDADGLRDIVLTSGGFPDKGHATSKVFRNLGDWRFERMALPTSLASVHDGVGAVVLDVDGDGQLDLLHFSLNDRERAIPTHRAWKGSGQGAHRSWPLSVTLPSAAALPLGTRLEATAPRPWLQVVRDAGAVVLPSWLEGQLLVTLPDGRVGVVELGDGPTGPLTATLELPDAPTLFTPGRQPLAPGRAVNVDGSPWFHALGPGWELVLDFEPRPGSVHLWHSGEHSVHDVPLYDEGLGCTGPDRCLIQLRTPGGGYTAVVLTPSTGDIQPLEAPGDMSVGHVVSHGRAWTTSSAQAWERDPTSYALLDPERVPRPKLKCEALAFDGDELACGCIDPPVLAIYDPDTLVARLELPLPSEGGGSLLATPAGWVVAIEAGLAWVDRDGGMRITQLGGESQLLSHDGHAWAVQEHRVLWLDLSTERVLGGMVAPGVGRALPVPEGGQAGFH